MRHPGTLTLRTGTFLSVLEDLIDSVLRGGFRNVLVLNGHGGNVIACRAAWDQILRRFQANLHFISYWDLLTAEDARECLEMGCALPTDLPGHAQEFETSCALALFPENVRRDVWSDQPDPKPAAATAEKGRVLMQRAADRVAAYVAEMMDGRRVAGVPAFHP
jgi:creatinine amidohydrolase